MTSSFKKTNNKESTRVKQLVGRQVPDSTQSPETIRGSCREKHTEKFQVEDGKGASVSQKRQGVSKHLRALRQGMG